MSTWAHFTLSLPIYLILNRSGCNHRVVKCVGFFPAASEEQSVGCLGAQCCRSGRAVVVSQSIVAGDISVLKD